MCAADYKLVNFPLAITGPVGWPVGEPPGGSIDTASADDPVAHAIAAIRPHRPGHLPACPA